MLSWAVLVLVISVVSGVLGFSGMAGSATGIAVALFFVLLIVFGALLILGRSTPA
jgi:uncharacterized membrane protein YtjA (UPF0391 family)